MTREWLWGDIGWAWAVLFSPPKPRVCVSGGGIAYLNVTDPTLLFLTTLCRIRFVKALHPVSNVVIWFQLCVFQMVFQISDHVINIVDNPQFIVWEFIYVIV